MNFSDESYKSKTAYFQSFFFFPREMEFLIFGLYKFMQLKNIQMMLFKDNFYILKHMILLVKVKICI